MFTRGSPSTDALLCFSTPRRNWCICSAAGMPVMSSPKDLNGSRKKGCLSAANIASAKVPKSGTARCCAPLSKTTPSS
eukprot:scaffold8935_cov69-Phaeocystis_antarctica.AAC.5